MTISVTAGPTTRVDTAVTMPIVVKNFDKAAHELMEDGKGLAIYANVTLPGSQSSTLRIAQTPRPSIYAGSGIDASAFLANKQGVDTVIELKEVWSRDNSLDGSTQLMPVRFAFTMTLPTEGAITDAQIEAAFLRLVSAVAKTSADTTLQNGINALRHGVVRKG